MLHMAIAYTNEDQSTASRFAGEVAKTVAFEHFTVGRSNEGEILADLLANYQGHLLLLVSDSFLTNPNCMLRGEAIFAEGRQVLPIVIDAHRYDEAADEVITVQTKLASRSDLMHYVNHWQDRYIELRRGAEALSAAAGPSFDNYLRKIRETSTQAEDVLQKLQLQWSLTAPQFSADNYRQLFLFADREDLWQAEPEPPTPEPAEEELPQPPDPFIPPPPDPEEEQSPSLPPEAEVEAITSEVREITPDVQAANWINRAWTMSDAGNTADGLELLNLGRENFPDQLDLHYQYALMLALGANDVKAARREVDTLLEKHPDHLDGLFLSGELHEATGNHIAARDDWEQLSDLEPFYLDLNQRLGLLLVEHFPDDQLDAAAHLRKAVKHEQAGAEAHFQYARLLAGPLERKKKAKKMLRRATRIDPEHAAAHYELAVALYDEGKIEAARKNFRLAVSLEPAYNTDVNRMAFEKKTTKVDALTALKQNIADLEEMLAAKEEDVAPAVPPRKGNGKTVMISGATSGIGLATAKRLAAEGYRLLLIGRRLERLEKTATALREDEGIEVYNLELDVRGREGVGKAIAELPEAWSDVDILLNNAGKAKGFDPIHAGDLDHWDEMIDVNLKGLLYLTRAVTPSMVARGSGLVINVCSTAGKEVYPNGNVYCATKHAVDALTYAMRLDLVKHGVKVGQICPAHVEETEFALVRFDGDSERAKIYNDFQPLRSSDVAEAIHFMIDQPPHVNIMDVVLQGTQQASSTVVDRSGRDKYAPEEE